MTVTFADVVARYHERKMKLGLLNSRAIDVREQYNGDIVIPLPELDRYEKNAVANLLAKGMDQMSMRSNSTRPQPAFPPVRPNIQKSEQDALDRLKCANGWDDMNKLTIKDGRAFRQFYGYGRRAYVICPDFKRDIPRWDLRDPLMTYPAPSADQDEMTPDDCIFTYHQTARWLKDNYPEAYAGIARRRYGSENMNELFEILEYIDDEIVMLGVLGTKKSPYDATIDGAETMQLVSTPNRAGICTAVIAQRITLDRPQGMYDGMLGMHLQQSMLQALGVIATKRGIFRDQWLIARQGEIPKIVQMADGLTGEIGIIQGGDIKTEPLDPSYMNPQMIDRIEEYQRQEAAIPAQMTGNGPTNSRTGRASDSILAATVDFVVQEAQFVFAQARQEEIKRAIAVDKAYWKRSKSFYVPYNGDNVRLDYKPSELWVTDEVRVSYAHAGVDEQQRTIEVSQLIGTGLISKDEGRRLHPLIKDAQLMKNQVTEEALEQALLAALQQQASQPGANIADYAQIIMYVTTKNMSLVDAVMQVQKEAQQRQASTDEEGNEDTVAPGSPQAQPGLAAPGQGAEAASAIQGPSSDQQNLSQLLGALGRPQTALAQAERA